MAFCQLGQLVVVVGGQIILDLAQLLVDDVEVVHEPFGGRRDRALFPDGTGERAVGSEQDAPVLGDAGPDDMPVTRVAGDRLGSRERRGVLLQALDAEELGEDRLLEVVRGGDLPTQDGSTSLGGVASISSAILSAQLGPCYAVQP